MMPIRPGWAVAAGTSRGLCALHLGRSRSSLHPLVQRDFPGARLAGPRHPLRPLLDEALRAVSTKSLPGTLRLDLQGTPFQLAVWRTLQRIPRGRTASYREVALRLGSPRAARAVAAACAANRIAVFVPCHRVVRGDGSLSGYRWGIERKRALLAAESTRAASSRLKRTGSSTNAE